MRGDDVIAKQALQWTPEDHSKRRQSRNTRNKDLETGRPGRWSWQLKTQLDRVEWSAAYAPLGMTRHRSSHVSPPINSYTLVPLGNILNASAEKMEKPGYNF